MKEPKVNIGTYTTTCAKRFQPSHLSFPSGLFMVAHTYRHKLNSCKHIGETSYGVFIVRCMFNV